MYLLAIKKYILAPKNVLIST